VTLLAWLKGNVSVSAGDEFLFLSIEGLTEDLKECLNTLISDLENETKKG